MDLLESSVSEIEVPPFEGHENFPTQPPKLESSTPEAAVSILNGWWTSEPKKTTMPRHTCPEILPMLSKHVHFNLHIPWIEHRHYCTSSFYSPRSPPSQSRNQSDLSCFWWLDMLMRYHWDRMVLSKNKPYSSPEPSLPHSNSTQMYLQTALWWNHFLHRLPQHWLCLVRNKHQYHPARILFPHIPGEWRSPQPPELPSQLPWHRRWGLLWVFFARQELEQSTAWTKIWSVVTHDLSVSTKLRFTSHARINQRCNTQKISGDVVKKLVVAEMWWRKRTGNSSKWTNFQKIRHFSIPRIRPKKIPAGTAPTTSHLRLGLSCAKCFNPPKPRVFFTPGLDGAVWKFPTNRRRSRFLMTDGFLLICLGGFNQAISGQIGNLLQGSGWNIQNLKPPASIIHVDPQNNDEFNIFPSFFLGVAKT